MSTILAHMVWP